MKSKTDPESIEKRNQKEFESLKREYPAISIFEYDAETHSCPTNILLSLTDDCNLACEYCFVKQCPRKMSLETARKGIEWCLYNYSLKYPDAGNGRPTVTFFGGEPLLLFEEIIQPIVEEYSERVNFSITTNGTLLDADTVDFLYSYKISILLSMDGPEEIQNFQRKGKGFNSFSTVIQNLQYLLLRFPNTPMRATLTKKSIPYLYEIFLMAEEIGFSGLYTCPNAFEDWNSEDLKTLTLELGKIGARIYTKMVEQKSSLLYYPLIQGVSSLALIEVGKQRFENSILRCGLGTNTCSLSPEGFLIPCQEKTSKPEENNIGHIDTGIDLIRHQAFLEDYWHKINLISCDKPCPSKVRMHCLSDTCPSRLQDQNFKKSSALCIYNRAVIAASENLFQLCRNSINPFISKYFSGGCDL